MLYITTRNNRDAFTVNRAMRENRCPDGGFYLPFRHLSFSQDEIRALAQKSFGQRVADVLNLLFHTKLTADDVDYCLGKKSVGLVSLPHRIFVAEAWHSPGYRFDHVVQSLAAMLYGEVAYPSDWMQIGIRAAVFFGYFGELQKNGIGQADVAVVSGDFSVPISAWYARRWGLPIGRIIVCCNENNALWELFRQGQMRTNAVSLPTLVPEADVTVPVGLERLLYEYGSISETKRFQDACRCGAPYSPGDSMLSKLRQGIYVSVISSQRLESTIPAVYRTHGCLMSPCTALNYSGLLDYRAKTGQTGPALIWSEVGPAAHAGTISQIMGIPEKKLGEYL